MIPSEAFGDILQHTEVGILRAVQHRPLAAGVKQLLHILRPPDVPGRQYRNLRRPDNLPDTVDRSAMRGVSVGEIKDQQPVGSAVAVFPGRRHGIAVSEQIGLAEACDRPAAKKINAGNQIMDHCSRLSCTRYPEKTQPFTGNRHFSRPSSYGRIHDLRKAPLR